MREELKKALAPILTEVGAIVQVSQQLEFGLKYAISLVKGLEPEEFSDEIFDVEFESLSKLTLGPLIGKFKKHVELRPGFEDTLADALKARNYVAHNFFTDRMELLATLEGRKGQLQYLQWAWKVVIAGVLAVDEVVPKLMAASGADPVAINEEAKRAIKL
jgi:hypothetical protein